MSSVAVGAQAQQPRLTQTLPSLHTDDPPRGCVQKLPQSRLAPVGEVARTIELRGAPVGAVALLDGESQISAWCRSGSDVQYLCELGRSEMQEDGAGPDQIPRAAWITGEDVEHICLQPSSTQPRDEGPRSVGASHPKPVVLESRRVGTRPTPDLEHCSTRSHHRGDPVKEVRKPRAGPTSGFVQVGGGLIGSERDRVGR